MKNENQWMPPVQPGVSLFSFLDHCAQCVLVQAVSLYLCTFSVIKIVNLVIKELKYSS